MYCPYCGQELMITAGQRYCVAGDMYLSQNLAAAIDVLIRQSPPPVHHETDTTAGASRWFCPRCQQRMSSVARDTLAQKCYACGLVLTGRIIYTLVEIHPHGVV